MTRQSGIRLLMAAGVSLLSLLAASAQDGARPVADWTLLPDYTLPRHAAAHPTAPAEPRGQIAMPLRSFSTFGMDPSATQRLDLAAPLAAGPFSIDMWVVNHVNQPVGAVVAPLSEGQPGWVLGYRTGFATFGPVGADGAALLSAKTPEEGYKERWFHLVGVHDGTALQLYINGVLAGTAPGAAPAETAALAITGYLKAEPYMEIDNLVQGVAVYDRALSADEVSAAFAARQVLIEEGRLYADRLHFTQSPYLNAPSMTGMEVSWETDRPTKAIIEWGETKDALQRAEIPMSAERLGGYSIGGLKADTAYFYRVTATDGAGNTLESGLLSFRTAPPEGAPFTIAISADTEGRPHINNRMSQLLWEERPNLLLLAGDLTDGGYLASRYEWTHEYFLGMGPLFGRVPVIAAPGNGEGELHWFRRYHRQPGEENYFSQRYGDVEIFVLDSNLGEREKETPGFRARQKAWLEGALKASTAKWKFTIHHHDIQTTDDDDYGDSWSGTTTLGDQNMQAEFRGLYEAYGVDLAIFGHLHAYERSWPLTAGKVDLQNGVTYLEVGGMGGNLEDFAPNKPDFNRKTVRAHHFVMAHGAGNRIDFEMIDSEGRTRDRFTLVKDGTGRAHLAAD